MGVDAPAAAAVLGWLLPLREVPPQIGFLPIRIPLESFCNSGPTWIGSPRSALTSNPSGCRLSGCALRNGVARFSLAAKASEGPATRKRRATGGLAIHPRESYAKPLQTVFLLIQTLHCHVCAYVSGVS